MLKRSLAALAAVTLLSLAACSDDSEDAKDAAGSDSFQDSNSGSATPDETAPSDDGEGTTEGSAAGACDYVVDGTAARPVEPPPATPVSTSKVKATIATTVGDIPIVLDAASAPCTVNSFISLTKQGFYTDTPCPRLASGTGFTLLQCGDPTGTGSGGPGYSYADELTGDETYPAGTLAMANAGADTNGSQFFLVIDDTQLAPNYTVFGSVDEAGLKVLAKVAAAGDDGSHPAGGGKPNTPVDITKITLS
ncbi:peptidylprolyl isomerase [Nocardioides sp. Bht2]|uniref:peptidylprolyl isomerase n=1 Tax=Nocardioides sp. Bht2 TaxID=3392297 RepID=UPI0039B5944E